MCRKAAKQITMLGNAMSADKFMEWYTAHRERVYWAIYHGEPRGRLHLYRAGGFQKTDHLTTGPDIKTHPENISKQTVYFVAARTPLRQSGPSIRFFRNLNYNLGMNVTVGGSRNIVQNDSEQPTPLKFSIAPLRCDVRARQGGNAALVVLELGHVKFYVLFTLRRGELELIPPKHET